MVYRPNYLILKEFLSYLADVMQVHEVSIQRYYSYLKHLLIWAGETPFQEADRIRPTFQSYVSTYPGSRHSDLAPLTVKKIFQITRRFFLWAKMEHAKDFAHVSLSWVNALRPAGRMSFQTHEHEYVTIDEILKIAQLPCHPDDLVARRDRAGAAMLYLSGMRASAFVSVSFEAVDLTSREVRQWPELGVRTKNAKKATTHLLEIPPLLDVAYEWDAFVRPRVPATTAWFTPLVEHFGQLELSIEPPGVYRNIGLNKRLRIQSIAAGLAYRSAHKFRHGNAVFGLQHARTMADYKAVSSNLMHEDITVTDAIYAALKDSEVKERIRALTSRDNAEDEIDRFITSLSEGELPHVLESIARRMAK